MFANKKYTIKYRNKINIESIIIFIFSIVKFRNIGCSTFAQILNPGKVDPGKIVLEKWSQEKNGLRQKWSAEKCPLKIFLRQKNARKFE